MSYHILLFDLDGTLLDFDANEAEALKELFRIQGYSLTEEVFETYQRINTKLWEDYANGLIPQKQILDTRFAKTMAEFGETVDGAEWESCYRKLLGNGHQLIDGAMEAVRELAATHRLFAVTNGVTETQENRLRQSGLAPYFEDVFTSQAIGTQKPDKAFFDHVMSHIEGFSAKDALMIGDSLSTDIKGGIGAGLATCWVNLKGQSCPEGLSITYTVTSLEELCGVCG